MTAKKPPKNHKEDQSEKRSEVAEKIARETLTGDLRDCLLNFLKHDKNPLPWNMQGEDRQREIIANVTDAVNRAVEKAVKIIAADGRPNILCNVDQVTIKDGIKATLSLSKSDDLRHALMDSQGSTALLVVSSSDPYIGERRPAKPEPNQKQLPMNDDGDDDEQAEAA